MINPYENVNWNTFYKVHSISHAHATTQSHFDSLYNGGVRHMAISNYHPSKAWYPLEDYFSNVPNDVIQCPNAEHWKMIWYGNKQGTSNIHINGIGSTYQSDNDQEPWGADEEFELVISRILDNLIYPDGGGITINHPAWSNWYLDRKALPIERVLRLLDVDKRVLGIEFYNDHAEKYQNEGNGWSIDIWDAALKTGRRAWGFAVPDHWHKTSPDWRGRNILLVSEETEHECLKAYREGRFFAKLDNGPLVFTNISVSTMSNVITVSTNTATTVSTVTDGIRHDYSGNSITVPIPYGSKYIRFEATDGTDMIFSNPIMLSQQHKNKPSISNMLVM